MKRFRLFAAIVAAVVVLLLLAVGVAFNASFQTWLVRRALARDPQLGVTVERVSAGVRHVELRGLRFENSGAVLTVPLAEAELPVLSAAFGEKISITQLVAKGWTLDLSKAGAGDEHGVAPVNTAGTAPAPRAGSGAATSPPVDTGATGASGPAGAFAGIFSHLRLPFDLMLDGVALEGEVILPRLRGRAKVSLRGGGVASGREGKFELRADTALADPAVSSLALHGTLAAAMDTPRSFSRLGARLEAAASGTQFPQGVKLTGAFDAGRAAAGETYALSVATQERPLLAINASLPLPAAHFDGTWSLDARKADIAPFALGQPLPEFTAAGAGKFDTDASFSAVHVLGHLAIAADQLGTIAAPLAAIGPLKMEANFDLAQRGELTAIEKLDASLAGAQPVARVRSLQAFEFNPRTRELKAADASRELVAIAVQALPLRWVQPFVPDFGVSGGDVRGEFVATARAGGVSLRSTAPVTLADGTLSQGGKPLLEDLDVALQLSGDYTPHGWQAALNEVSIRDRTRTLLTGEVKAGQLAGTAQPVKAAGKLNANLAPLLAQPIARELRVPLQGEAAVDFAASLAEKQELFAKILATKLVAPVEGEPRPLPALSVDLRADVAPGGQITLNAPLVLEQDGRKSDLTLVGTLKPDRNRKVIEARVTSAQLIVDDAKRFAALLPEKSAPPAKAAPPWAGIDGVLALQLKSVVYSEAFRASDVTGTLRLEGGNIKLETVRAGVGERGEARLDGTLTFEPSQPQPYALAAELALSEFEVGTLFRAVDPARPATIEGSFSVASAVRSRGARLGELPGNCTGDFQVTSRGGLFRGLPLNVANPVETTSRIASWIASAGATIGAWTGKKESTEPANKTQAVAEFAKGIYPIAYDQLSVLVTREANLNTRLKDFTLISPELRLTGGGVIAHRAGVGVLGDPLTMEFQLRAQGRPGDLLKYLGVLDAQPDALGYAACTIPIKIGGTLAKPDTSDFGARMVAMTVDKGGLIDRATDWFGKSRTVK